MAIPVDKKAPNFELPSTDGSTFKLSERLADKHYVLVFVHNKIEPLDRRLILEFQNHHHDFVSHGTEIMIVCRQSLEKLQEYKSNHQLPFELLSDWYGETADAYKVSTKIIHFTSRISFIIHKSGKVKAVFPPKLSPKIQPEISEESQITENIQSFIQRIKEGMV